MPSLGFQWNLTNVDLRSIDEAEGVHAESLHEAEPARMASDITTTCGHLRHQTSSPEVVMR
jgi:hypothetical protein